MFETNNLELEEFLRLFENENEITFLEQAKKEELLAIAKAKGVLINNSRDLVMFSAVFTFADKMNGNGVVIPEAELLRALPSLIGKSVTLDHVRRYVVGSVLDYRYIAKEKKVIIYCVFFKQIFAEEWDKALKLFKDHKLAVSSEIWSPKSARQYISAKEYKIYNIEFAGCTLVMTGNPAFEETKVLETAKKNYIEQEELIFATIKQENLEILTCGKCKSGKDCGMCESLLTATQEGVAPVQPAFTPAPVQPNKMKIICQHCSHNFEHLFIQGQNNPINCPNCSAILDQAGKVIYPPQIKNFDLSCPNCQARNNWLTEASQDNEAKVKCNSCQREYVLKFKKIPEEYKTLLGKLMFLRTGKIPCIQCGTYNNFSVPSTQKKIEIKCKKCNLEFSFDIEDAIKRDIASFEEYKEIPIIKEEKKMTVVLEQSKVRQLLRKAVSKRIELRKKMEEKEKEIECQKAKKAKFVKGIKKYVGKCKELTGKCKEHVLETSKLKEELKNKETELEKAKLVPSEPVVIPAVEPVLEVAKATIGDKHKDEDHYAEARKKVNEKDAEKILEGIKKYFPFNDILLNNI